MWAGAHSPRWLWVRSRNHPGAGVWGDVRGSGVTRTEGSWGRSLPHPAGTKGVRIEPQTPWQGPTCHGCGQAPPALGEAQSQQAAEVPAATFSQDRWGFWDLFASLRLLCCLSSEEMGLALSLVQSALPWTLVQLKGLRLELFSCLGQSCGQEEGWKPAPVPSTSKSPLSQSSSRALPNGRASHSSSKSPPVKHVPLLGG